VFFRSLRARRSFWVAGIGSSLLFGLAHLSVEDGSGWGGGMLLVTLMFFVGFGFAYVYERRGNILANMIAHATFNTVGLVLIVLFS
jgi:membrane protease YdiL (CAAX protease family)